MKVLLFVLGILFSFFSYADEKFDQLLKAAKQGNAKAQHAVAMSYFLAKNHESTVYWYRQAVMQGDEDSLYNLGMLYCSGYGVKKNIEACYALVSLIKKDTSMLNEIQLQFSVRPLAKEKLEDLSRKMTDDQIVAAEVLTAEMSKPKNLLTALDEHLKEARETD
jgi:TPR repeat protein